MKLLPFFIFISVLCCVACDDGDIIVNDFEFEEEDLDFCRNRTEDAILYNLNSTTNEALIIILDSSFSDTIVDDITESIDVANRVIYRKLANSVGNARDYFCSGFPSTEVGIVSELISDRGTINITVEKNLTLLDDIDGDGLSNVEEGFIAGTPDTELLNTDGDEFPNYLDQDDDNDNILTITERAMATADPMIDDTEIDTDNDGIPNYLDGDDDNDDILTRDEAAEAPETPEGEDERVIDPTKNLGTNVDLPKYLDPNERETNIATKLLDNRITATFQTRVILDNLGLTDGTNTIVRDRLIIGNTTATKLEITDNLVPGSTTPETPMTAPTP